MKKVAMIISFILTWQNMIAQELPYCYTPVFDNHLRFAYNKDLLDSIKTPILGFYSTLDGSIIGNKYWLESDYEKLVTPYSYLMDVIEVRGRGVIYPYIMSISSDSIYGDFLAQIAYLRRDSVTAIENIYYIVVTKNQNNEYRLKHPGAFITRNWEKHQIGSINYIVNPKKTFSHREANKMDSFNKWIAKYFHKELIPISYYSCGYLPDLNLPQGEYNFFMTGNYTRMIGGNANTLTKTIYSGNNSEFYPHELVHIYLAYLVADPKKGTSTLAHEGISTFLGGSVGLTVEEHLHIVAVYARKNNIGNIIQLLAIPGGLIDETDAMYAVGGLMAKLVHNKTGYKGIVELANVTDAELFTYLSKKLNVSEEEILSYLMNELMKYE